MVSQNHPLLHWQVLVKYSEQLYEKPNGNAWESYKLWYNYNSHKYFGEK